MLSLQFDPFPLLSTTRLILREINSDDINEIFFLRSDKEVIKYLDKHPAKSPDEALDFINKITAQQKNNESITWGIQLKEFPQLIGTICFWNITAEHYRAEIGYALYPGYQHKGIMQEAMSTVLEYGKNTMKLHSVEANINPGNISSIKILEKNSFTRDAYFKENFFYDGKFVDTVIYSLVFS